MSLDFARFDAANFTGIPERAVLDHAYPPYGFVRQWMDYMYSVTDAPLVYHLGVGLGVLSTFVPPNVFLPDADELRANMFVMLVGPSANARKTFAVKHAREQIQNVGGTEYVLGDTGSGEGYADEVIANPRRIIVAEEGGNFLQHTARGQYGDKVRSQLLSMFDCSPLQRVTVGAKKAKGTDKPPRQDNPRVSMLMGLTKAHLEDYTFRSDWDGGFLSRYVTLWARRERDFEEARMNEPGRNAMRSYLRTLMNIITGGECAGMKPEAKAYFRTWQKGLNAFAATQDEKTMGVVERAQAHARKAALVLAYDRHIAEAGGHSLETLVAGRCEAPWYLDVCDVAVGCSLGTFSMFSSLHIERNITDNEDGQLMNRIVNFIRKNEQNGAASLPEILRYVNRPMKRVQAYLETLCAAERLGSTGAMNGNYGTTVYFVPDSRWAQRSTELLARGALPTVPVNDDHGTKH